MAEVTNATETDVDRVQGAVGPVDGDVSHPAGKRQYAGGDVVDAGDRPAARPRIVEPEDPAHRRAHVEAGRRGEDHGEGLARSGRQGGLVGPCRAEVRGDVDRAADPEGD